MPQNHIDRRRVLTFGAATALGVWSGFGTSSARTPNDRQPDQISPADLLHFAVTIPGMPETSKNIREIGIDELNIDARETRGRDQELWQIRPGSVHVGSATFTSVVTPGSFKEVKAWFDEASASKGKNIRKNITVTLFKSDGKTERVFGLVGCFPTSFSSVNFDTSSTVQTETLRVKLGRIEFKV